MSQNINATLRKAVSCFPACFTTRPCLLCTVQRKRRSSPVIWFSCHFSCFSLHVDRDSLPVVLTLWWWLHSRFLFLLAVISVCKAFITCPLISRSIHLNMKWGLRLPDDSPMMLCLVWLSWIIKLRVVVCSIEGTEEAKSSSHNNIKDNSETSSLQFRSAWKLL